MVKSRRAPGRSRALFGGPTKEAAGPGYLQPVVRKFDFLVSDQSVQEALQGEQGSYGTGGCDGENSTRNALVEQYVTDGDPLGLLTGHAPRSSTNWTRSAAASVHLPDCPIRGQQKGPAEATEPSRVGDLFGEPGCCSVVCLPRWDQVESLMAEIIHQPDVRYGLNHLPEWLDCLG